MIPVEILIENFKSHKHTLINCNEFNAALITGSYKNNVKKSNGVGKTTLFDAIEYVLFGVADVDHLDDIVSDDQEKCLVSFVFEMPQGIFKITRSRNKRTSKSEVYLYQINDTIEKNISQKTAKETDFEIAKLIKISHVAFRNSTYFAQRDMFGLAAATPKERKSILKEPLQITVYNKYEKIAKDKLSVIQKNIGEVKAIISAIGDPNASILSLKADITQANLELVQICNSKDLLSKELSDKKDELAVLQASIKESSKPTLEIKLGELQAQIEVLLTKIASVDGKLHKAKASLNDCENKISSKSKDIEQLELVIKNQEKILLDLEADPRSKPELETKLEAAKTNEANGRVHVARVEDEIQKLSKPMKFDENCVNCKQVIAKDYWQEYETSRASNLEIAKTNLAKYRPALEKAITKRKNIENEISEIISNKQKIESIKNTVTSKLSQIEINKSQIDNDKSLMIQHNLTITTLTQERNDLNANEKSLTDEILKIKKDIELISSNDISKNIDILSKDISGIIKSINDCEVSERKLSVNVGTYQALIQKHQSDLLRILDSKNELDNFEDEYIVLQKVAQAFSSGGIPTFIINTVLDDLQIEANKILSEIRPELEIIFSISRSRADGQQEDTLDISYRVNGRERKYRQLSGGQKWFVALGLKMGLSIIIQRRLGVDIRLLEFDEIDEPMDTVGKESFWNLIKKWQETFKIFIITHDEYLKSKFSNVIMIENDPEKGSFGKLISEDSN